MWHSSSNQLIPHRAWKLFVPGMLAALLLAPTLSIPDTEPLQAQGLIMPNFWRAWRHTQNVAFI